MKAEEIGRMAEIHLDKIRKAYRKENKVPKSIKLLSEMSVNYPAYLEYQLAEAIQIINEFQLQGLSSEHADQFVAKFNIKNPIHG